MGCGVSVGVPQPYNSGLINRLKAKTVTNFPRRGIFNSYKILVYRKRQLSGPGSTGLAQIYAVNLITPVNSIKLHSGRGLAPVILEEIGTGISQEIV